MTKIKRCTCVNSYQDKRYGKHRRVHNKATGGTKRPEGWVCTVCDKHTSGE